MAEVSIQVYADWMCRRCFSVVYNPKAAYIDDRWQHTRVAMDRDGNAREQTCVARTSEGTWLDRVHASIVH